MKKGAVIGLIIISFLLSSGCDLTKTVIMGKVYDAKTEEPLPNVVVETIDGQYSTQTDQKGWYRLEKLPHGTYQLRAKMTGYQSLEKEAVLTKEKYEFVRNFYLTPK